MNQKSIALIGLDTSHTVEFTRLMQEPGHQVVEGLRAVKAFRFPSAFQSEENQDKRQEALEKLGVAMAPSVEETCAGMDAVFLEINDPALHLAYFEQVAGLGLPVFIDKPLAATTGEGRRIAEIAAAAGIPVWSSSSLRFIPLLAEARRRIPEPLAVHTFGALGKAAAGSDLVWYGVHAVEMLVAGLGTGARAVRALEDQTGITLLIEYPDKRRGLVECLRGLYRYGGRLQSGDEVCFFDSGTGSPYVSLMGALRDFVCDGVVPVSLDEAREVLGILEAGGQSLARNAAPVAVAR